MKLTGSQAHCLRMIAENGGYAALFFGRDWRTARFIDGASPHYEIGEHSLSRRPMEALRAAGRLRHAPGHGYGNWSFWEVVET